MASTKPGGQPKPILSFLGFLLFPNLFLLISKWT